MERGSTHTNHDYTKCPQCGHELDLPPPESVAPMPPEVYERISQLLARRMIDIDGSMVLPKDAGITAVVFDGATHDDPLLGVLRKNHPPTKRGTGAALSLEDRASESH